MRMPGRHKILMGTIFYNFANGVSILAGMLIVYMLTHMFNPYEFGIISLYFMIIFLFNTAFGMQLDPGVLRFYAGQDADSDKKALLTTAASYHVALSIAVSLVLSAIYFMIIPYLNLKIHAEDKFLYNHTTIVLTLVIFPLSSFRSSLNLILTVLTRYKSRSAVLTIKSIFMAFFIYLFVEVLGLQINGVLYSIIASEILACGVGMQLSKKFLSAELSADLLVKLLRFSLPSVIKRISLWAMPASSLLILNHHFPNSSQLGVLSLLNRIGSAFLTIPLSFIHIWLPTSYVMMQNIEADNSYENMLKLFSAFTILSLVCVSFIINPVLILFIPKNYHSLIHIIPITLAAISILCFNRIFENIIELHKKTHLIASLFLSAFIFHVIINYFLILRAQVVGAAFGMMLSMIFLYLLSQFNVKDFKVVQESVNRSTLIVISISFLISITSLATRNLNPIYVYSTNFILNCAIILIYWNLILCKSIRKKMLSFISTFLRSKLLIKNF